MNIQPTKVSKSYCIKFEGKHSTKLPKALKAKTQIKVSKGVVPSVITMLLFVFSCLLWKDSPEYKLQQKQLELKESFPNYQQNYNELIRNNRNQSEQDHLVADFLKQFTEYKYKQYSINQVELDSMSANFINQLSEYNRRQDSIIKPKLDSLTMDFLTQALNLNIEIETCKKEIDDHDLIKKFKNMRHKLKQSEISTTDEQKTPPYEPLRPPYEPLNPYRIESTNETNIPFAPILPANKSAILPGEPIILESGTILNTIG